MAGWGRIIFISSESAVNIPVEMIHYGVTKPCKWRSPVDWPKPQRERA